MKKIQLLIAAYLLTFGFITFSISQSPDYLQRAYTHIEDTYGLEQGKIGDLKIKSQYHSAHNGVDHLTLVQVADGIEIFGTSIMLAFQKNGKVSSVNHQLRRLDQYPVNRKTPKLSAAQAIPIAAASLGVTGRSAPSFIRQTQQGVPVFAKSDISLQDIPVDLGYIITHDNTYSLVYMMYIEPVGNGQAYRSYVDAEKGKTIANESMTLRCRFDDGYMHHENTCHEDHPVSLLPAMASTGMGGTYRVLPVSVESPNHGDFLLVTGAEDPDASPLGWHDDDGIAGADFTYTRGNNVHAFPDRNWDYAPDASVDGGAGLLFDFPYDDNVEPVTNQPVAVTNLFYWNNVMHDFTYQYGFNEAAGNFQEYNYSGEGEGGDFIEAQAQFGDLNPSTCGVQANNDIDCINNADFSQSPDGFNGRMRMFTWNRDNSSRFLDVLEPADLGGKILTGLPEFGPQITAQPVTGEVVVIDDASFDPTMACFPVTQQPELDGKIAIIDRGTCDFSLKVYYAQEAGAIGAIICNFEDVVIPMGNGEQAGAVAIPSVLISSVECERIRIAAGTGLVVSFVAPQTGGPERRDGSLDNGIIAHEYGHGISNRLTGGPALSGCLSPGFLTGAAEEAHSMGEGWSDFFALITTVQPGDTGSKRRGIGTYSNKEATNGRGIRPYPYSTDMTVNPYTYEDAVLETVPYGVGSIWCTMIWDLYWAMSDTYGWDPDLYKGTGGNNMAIQLIIDGLKLQGCNPGLVDARDAILEADMINYDGANQCLIWETFARRGLGFDADGGDPNTRSDGKAGFDLPVACRDDLRLSKSMTPEVIAGQQIEVTLNVSNYRDETLTNVFLEDIIPQGCSYLSGSGTIEPDVIGDNLLWAINSLDPDEELTITYLLQTDPENHSIRIYYDDIEGSPDERWDTYFDPELTITNFWAQQDSIYRSGTAAWRVGSVPTESEHFLENFEPYAITGNYPVYRFYTYHNTQTGVDGGFLEISTEDNEPWVRLEPNIFRGGYPRKLEYTTFAIPNLGAYSGLSDSTKKMHPVYIDLRDYIDQDIRIRYRFGTNEGDFVDGWYVDDVEVMDAVIYNSTACLSSDQTPALCAEAPARGTIMDSQVTSSTSNEEIASGFTVFPNPAGDFIQLMITSARHQDAVLSIINLTGQAVTSQKWPLISGVNQQAVPISNLVPGAYLLTLKTGESIQSKIFIKE